MIKIFRDQNDCVLTNSQRSVRVVDFCFDSLFRAEDPAAMAKQAFEKADGDELLVDFAQQAWLAPIGSQEIWAAGVTYFRSRSARMEESESSGGDRFYELVYEAERPELFFKSTASRARGHRAQVCIRSDSDWDVPEPELTLAINAQGHIFGYTIGNDMSSRSIEGANPLYLPQAKMYRGSCAIGPALVIPEPGEAPLIDGATEISILIQRDGETAFSGATEVSQIKRSFTELAEFLFRDNELPQGAYLMTGTGIVPDPPFTLAASDSIEITIGGLGTLVNQVE